MKLESWTPIQARTSAVSLPVLRIWEIDQKIWDPKTLIFSQMILMHRQRILVTSLTQFTTFILSYSIKNWLVEDHRNAPAMRNPSLMLMIFVKIVEFAFISLSNGSKTFLWRSLIVSIKKSTQKILWFNHLWSGV